jgi:hypothetical protein
MPQVLEAILDVDKTRGAGHGQWARALSEAYKQRMAALALASALDATAIPFFAPRKMVRNGLSLGTTTCPIYC